MIGYWNYKIHTLRLFACDPLSVVVVTSKVVAESCVDGAVVVQSTIQSVRIRTTLRWNGCGVVTFVTNNRRVQQRCIRYNDGVNMKANN